MKKSEWIEYYIALNGKKPSKQEIDDALKHGDYQVLEVEKRAKSRTVIIGIFFMALLFGFVIFNNSNIQKNFSDKGDQLYEDNFNRIINKYQEALDSYDSYESYDLEGIQVMAEQPSRQPSYIRLDSDDDDKDELYILFDDGESGGFELLAAYSASFTETIPMDLEEVDQANVKNLINRLSDSELYYFDVDNLLTMNQTKLLDSDYSDLEGKWITDNGSVYSLKFGESGIEMMNIKKENDIYKDYSSGQSILFGDIQEGQFKGDFTDGSNNFELTFLPKGIYDGVSKDGYDRIYYEAENLYFYRYDEIIDTVYRKPIDIVDILEGDYKTLAGRWKNKSGNPRWSEITIDENGVLKNVNEDNGLPIGNVDVINGGYLHGHLMRNSTLEGTSVAIIPADVEVNGARNADENRDRIAIGDPLDRYNDPQVFYRVKE